jgi:uncharacterized membrane protein
MTAQSKLEAEEAAQDTRYTRSCTRLWFLYFAGIGQALANLTTCTGEINGGNHLILATVYPCLTSKIPAAFLLGLLLCPSGFVILTAYLRTRSPKV